MHCRRCVAVIIRIIRALVGIYQGYCGIYLVAKPEAMHSARSAIIHILANNNNNICELSIIPTYDQ